MAATGWPGPAMRSVEFARNHGVPLHVRSSFTWEPGTWVTEEDHDMEEPIISGVTHDAAEAKVTVAGVPDRPGIAARLFRALADAGVNVDMIVQNTSSEGPTDISFTVPKATWAVAEEIVRRAGRRDRRHRRQPRRRHRQGEPRRRRHEDEPGHRRHDVRDAGGRPGINIEMISTSAIRMTCVVARAGHGAGGARAPRRLRAGQRRRLRRAAARAPVAAGAETGPPPATGRR